MKPSIQLYALTVLQLAFAAPAQRHQQNNGVTSDPSAAADKSFDYIIAGGGLTGLTVASRLTEDPEISVLVIEAGQDDHADPRVNDVRTYGEAFNSQLDHGIYSTPVKEQNDTGLLLVAGKTLGGSGSLNGASWTKGPKTQYDVLPLLTGDNSWGWEGLNEYMLKAENFHVPDEDEIANGAQWIDSAHAQGGPVQVSFAEGLFGGIQQPALEASEKVWKSMQRNKDASSGVARGATIIPNMLAYDDSQNRSSPFTAYAQRQVEERPNFTILTGHRVTQVLWSEGKPAGKLQAKGVTFQSCPSCPVYTAHTTREIFLAAGSLQSPQLLELSGVGDPSVLGAAGIPLKLAAPGVGKNMQEQTKNTLLHTPKSTEFGGTGPPAAIAFPDVHQLFDPVDARALYENIVDSLPAHAAELEARGLVTNASATETILRAQIENLFGPSSEPAAEVFFVTDPKTGKVGLDVWNLIVLSRGSVHVSSPDPWTHPVVEPNYFGHAYDLAVQIAACKQSREVFLTSPLAEMIQGEDSPGDFVKSGPQGEGDEDEAWETWVRGSFTSVWHYIATAAMMKEELGGVVDERLRVYGLQNVRVVDASVLPIQLSAHLSSSLYGIAEKAAAMIEEDRRA